MKILKGSRKLPRPRFEASFLFDFKQLALLIGLAIGLSGCAREAAETGSQSANPLVTPNGTITQAGDEGRTGWFPDQPALDPSTVGGAGFKRIFQTTLPLLDPAGKVDYVYAQPLVSGNRVFIASASNNLFSLDAVTGAVVSQRNLGKPFAPSVLQCGDQTWVGITGTPVIDANTNTAYFFSKVADANNNGSWFFRGVDVGTLADKFPAVPIAGNATNDPTVPFAPQLEHQRPGVLLLNGVVYGAFGGHCDKNLPDTKYRGWVVGVSTAGQITTMYSTEDHTGDQAGIWQSGGGLASDGPNRLFYVTGNGTGPNHPLAGNAPPTVQGQSLVQVAVQANKSLLAQQFFAPYNLLGDADFSAGGPVILPSAYFGTTATPNLMIAAGKLQVMYLLDRDHLGGYEQSPTIDTSYNPARHTDLVVGQTALEGNGSWAKPAVWPGDGGWVYQVGSGAPLMALKYGVNGGGIPTLSLVGRSPETYGFSSGSAVVTSSGATTGSAVVWISQTGGGGQTGTLRAYKAVPVGGVLQQLFADAYGLQVKFTNPGVGAGRVYVGGQGTVTGYGSSDSGPVSANATDFGTVPIGSSQQFNVTLSANQALSVTGITSPDAAFSVGAPSPAYGTPRSAGQTVVVPVTFTPSTVQSYEVRLAVATTAGPGSAVVRGVGQFNGPRLAVSPSTVTMGTITTGSSKTANVVLQSVGSQAVTFSGFTQPSAPFSVTGLPAIGSTLASGASVSVNANYAPTAAGSHTGSFVVASNGGNVTLPLSGAAGPPPKLTLSSLALDYGDVALGTSESLTFTVKNSGGSDLTILKSKPPVLGPFTALAPGLPEGTVILAGQSVTLTVAFNPAAAGAASDGWVLNSNDAVTGLVTVQFSGSANQTVALARTGWVASATQSSATDVPANALDGATNTRFTTAKAQAVGQTFQVDLAAQRAFSQISLNAGSATDYPAGFQVFVSNDGVTWGSPIATGAGGGQLTIIPVGTQNARYVRIALTAASTHWWSIAELNLGISNGQPVTPLPRGSWVPSASPAGDSQGLAFDGLTSTRWTSGANQVNGQYFQVDMAAPQTFTQVTLDTGAANINDYARGYAAYVSTDGLTWGSPVATGTGLGQVTTIAFAQQTARYLRIVQTGTINKWWTIAEFNVYAGGTTPPPPTPPEAASGLVATAGASGVIGLAWSASTTANATYSVFRSLASGFTPGVSNQVAAGLTSLSYSDAGLASSTTYFYLVEAVNGAGASAPTNQATATTVPTTPTTGVQINCGGPGAAPFLADQFFVGGGTVVHANVMDLTGVTNPAPTAVYQSGRSGAFTYTITGFTPGSVHTVRLHFAETYFTAVGARVFNVNINSGAAGLTSFDIIAASGAKNKAVDRTFSVAANASGNYVIQATSITNVSLLSGIEIQ